jgi:hypothetical protein
MKTPAAFLLTAALLTACVPTPQASPEPQKQAMSSAASTEAVSSVPAANPLPQAYTDAAKGYSIDYPAGWTVLQNARSPLTYKLKAGTAFVPPESFGKGTTYMDGLVFVETSRMPCARFVNAKPVTLNGKEFFKGDSTTTGTQSYRRYTTYVTSNEKTRTCYSVMLYVRVCTMGTECGQEHLNSFDAKEANATVEKMAASLRFR